MPLKNILTYSDGDRDTNHRLSAAVRLAEQNDAHLTVLAFGFEPELPPSFDGSLPLPLPPSTALPDAENRARMAAGMMASAGVRGDAVPVVCPISRFGREFGEAARFTDLVVLGRPYGEGLPYTAGTALEGALFDGDAAVLVFPDGMERLSAEAVIIAWNGSREALRSVRRAMPFLSAAPSVRIAIIGSSTSEPDPGERLATMLSRNGIHPEILVQTATDEGITATLRRCVRETGAGLIVMGAYSHSRFREYIIGGVTRDLLTEFSVPVLMAH